MEDEGADPPALRVSDAERDQTLDRLRRAVAEGRIDIDEFGDRTTQVLEARTRDDLERCTADLPAAMLPAGADEAEVELRAILSTLRRRGNWAVPRRLALRSRLSTTNLDFSEAHLAHPVVEVAFDVIGGTVELRLPDGASASVDGVKATLGTVEDRRPSAAGAGAPHFVLTGRVVCGTVEVRGPGGLRTGPFHRP